MISFFMQDVGCAGGREGGGRIRKCRLIFFSSFHESFFFIFSNDFDSVEQANLTAIRPSKI